MVCSYSSFFCRISFSDARTKKRTVRCAAAGGDRPIKGKIHMRTGKPFPLRFPYNIKKGR